MNFSETKNPNDLWIIHREEIDTLQDGICDIYVLLDAITGHCFGMETSKDLPSSLKILTLIKNACSQANVAPQLICILKKDPLSEVVAAICSGLKIPFATAIKKEIMPFTDEFSRSFKQFKMGNQSPLKEPEYDEVSNEEVESFVPDTYGPCPCASGQKYKFCCQKAFKDIVFAMCDAQDGHLEKALFHMAQAESKTGTTAEILCRYGICWSFFDRNKSDEYLSKALEKNPNHPRANYILGINCVEKRDYQEALKFYQRAIDNYPPGDKFHLNETYNNLGTAYYEQKNFQMAKESWEKALVLLPSDRIVKNNLFEFIYNNSKVPNEIRAISPFIEKYLKRG